MPSHNDPLLGGASPVPVSTGIGLKASHYRDLLELSPDLPFLEVHPENYMGEGGPPHRYLSKLAECYPLSFHGVGLSLGGVETLDADHLARWRSLVDRYSPLLVSEHIAWSTHAGIAHHDLLPLPYTEEALEVVCDNIAVMQDALGREVLVENPSTYLQFASSTIPETEFLIETTRRTGCRLLLDVNNVYVSAKNHGFDPARWLALIPGDIVGEIHLAGHATINVCDHQLRIDDHGSHVCKEVWSLYGQTIARIGQRHTLIEWDTNVPALSELLLEAASGDLIAAKAISDRHALTI